MIILNKLERKSMKKIIIFLCAILLCAPVFSVENIVSAGVYVSQFSLMKKYKDIAHNPIAVNKMKNQAKNLSADEKSVIKKYVFGAVKGEDTYLLINCNLRNTLQYYIPKKEITKPLKCRLDYYANQLSAPISKMRLPQNIILYRGVDEKGFKLIFADKKIDNYVNKPVTEENLSVLKQKLVGSVYTEKGFMSTSYDINSAEQTKFIFEISAPKGLQAVLIEDFGKKEEKEVLINCNSQWKVTDVKIDKNKKTKQDFYKISVKFIKN